MSEIIHTLLRCSVLRSEYRQQLSESLKVAEQYHGTEPEYQLLIKVLSSLERWLNDVFGQEQNHKFSDELEEKVVTAWQEENRKKIDDVLQAATESLRHSISEILRGKESGDAGLLALNLPGIILTPKDQSIQPPNGGGHEFEDPRFQERIRDLIMALNENRIRTDDLILIRGSVRESMMRKVSYAILEIPKMNREILICDQVGEATFVIYGIQGRQTLMSENKEELQNRLGARIIRIIYNNPDQWKNEVIASLLRDVNLADLDRTNVRECEGLRFEILKQYPTPESWAGVSHRSKRSFEVIGLKLTAIADVFGLVGDPFRQSNYLRLGEKIYGEGYACLKLLNLDELRAKILLQVPLPQAWAEMTVKKKLDFKIADMGLAAIARKFGVEGQPVSDHRFHLELGRKIYGEEFDCLRREDGAGLTQDQVKKQILNRFSNPEAWAHMKVRDKLKFKIAGMGLIAIASKFGVGGGRFYNYKFHLELGRKIYGEDHECLRYAEIPKLTLSEIRAEIKKKYLIPEAWARMKQKVKAGFKVADMGLCAIAHEFGVGGNPVDSHQFHLELGRKIYGDNHECFNIKTFEEIKAEIRAQFPTPDVWARMKAKDKAKLKIVGFGLVSIATMFGVKGSPVTNHSVHLELGRKFFGEGYECLRILNVDEIKQKILEQIPTPEAWAGMKLEENKKFNVAGIRLRGIATRLGLKKGDPVCNCRDHLELGRIIYGEEHECLMVLTPDELRVEILKQVATPKDWAEMTREIKPGFSASGMKLTAIASEFGIEGSPIHDHKFHLELGRKIFGDEHECLYKKTHEEIRNGILKQCPTFEVWAEMIAIKKEKFKVFGIGLNAIARKFGVVGNPIRNHRVHLELGEKIFGKK